MCHRPQPLGGPRLVHGVYRMHEDTHHDDQPPAAARLGAGQIAAFWSDFSAGLSALEALDGQEFVERANELLQRHAPGLALELEGRPAEAGARLIVTAHGNIEQFENVQALVREAPRCPPYAVQAFRSRMAPGPQGSDFAMHMQGFELSCAEVLVAHYDAGGIVGLELAFAKPIPQDMAEHARHMAFIMLDHVLGEWDFSVRVGPVDFVDASADARGDAQPLSAFPPVFDAFQREVLGRSYAYPQEDEDRWISLEVRARDAGDDEPPGLLSFHDGANALATRADLSHFLTWTFPVSSQQELDSARDAQDALEAQLLSQQGGILAFSRMERMQSRVAAFYVADPADAVQRAERIAARHAPGLEAELQVVFDPAWHEYLGLYSAIHRNRHAKEAA